MTSFTSEFVVYASMVHRKVIRLYWKRVTLALVYSMLFGTLVLVHDSQLPKDYYVPYNNSSNNSDASGEPAAPTLTTVMTMTTSSASSSTRGRVHRCELPVRFPDYVNLKRNNVHWQQVKEMDVFLYSAYYDGRQERRHGGHVVRVLAMKDICAMPTMYCQLWYGDTSLPVIVKAKQQWMWFNCKEPIVPNEYHAIMYTCPLPRQRGADVPRYVSIAPLPCMAASNALGVINNRPETKHEFAVCVKGLNFLDTDISYKLIEWIEMQRLLGAQKVFFYKYDVTPDMDDVLRYYENAGIVDVTQLSLPGAHPNEPYLRYLFVKNNSWQSWLTEVLLYTDCLYRNINSYRYLAVIDIDEIIIPMQDMTWHGMMSRLSRLEPNIERYGSYTFRNVYFLDQFSTHLNGKFPAFMHTLQHVNRSANLSPKGEDIKSFVNTQGALILHNHWPLRYFPGYEPVTYSVDDTVARMQHYRSSCSTVNETACDPSYIGEPVTDTTIWKYAKPLVRNTLRTIDALRNMQMSGS